jgi:hypothetical protein
MSPQERFEKYVKRETHGCWLWTGALNDDGYGRFFFNGKNCHAHRVAYELGVGPIPEGLVIDHLCRNRCCVNPSHLEPVTLAENIRRGDDTLKAWKLRLTHCPHGHEYSPENTRVKVINGRKSRDCKACDREQKRRPRRTN